jgi:quaternary ammonium compound-resistance protein SugE
MAWTYLFIAGLFEIGFAISLKFTEGYTNLIPSIFNVVMGMISFATLAQALRELPVGTAYTIWTGMGSIGAVILGIVFFNESRDLPRLVCIAVTMIGILGLKLTSA